MKHLRSDGLMKPTLHHDLRFVLGALLALAVLAAFILGIHATP